jgi:GH24 family phage-related lysozyme (muramidase)
MMGWSGWRRTRRVALGAAWLALLISGVTGAAGNASPGKAAGRAAMASPGGSLEQYTVTLTLTGTATQTGDNHCTETACAGDLSGMSYSAQFQVTETWAHVLLPVGKGAPTLPQTGGVMTQHTVTGTYTEAGNYDPDGSGNLVPYSCSGSLADNAAPESDYALTGDPAGSSWNFTAQILHYGLAGTTTSGGPSGSPCDNSASFVDGPSSAFGDPEFAGAFSIADSQLGKDPITETVTGPPADATPAAHDCGEQCTFAMSWTAKITFTPDCQQHKSMSEQGKNQLKKEEGGLVKKPYNDQQHYCTVGIGHLLHMSPCGPQDYKDWNPKTDGPKLDQQFTQDLSRFQDALNKTLSRLGVKLTQCQYDALIDLMFNAGEGAVTNRSNSGIYKDLAAGNLSGISGAITSEDYGSAKVRAKREKRTAKTKHDLAKRRGAEAKEFNANCPC